MDAEAKTDAAPAVAAEPIITDRQVAIKAYFEAATPEAKSVVVKQYPLLREIFSALNHSA